MSVIHTKTLYYNKVQLANIQSYVVTVLAHVPVILDGQVTDVTNGYAETESLILEKRATITTLTATTDATTVKLKQVGLAASLLLPPPLNASEHVETESKKAMKHVTMET